MTEFSRMLEQARGVLPLHRLMEQRGHAAGMPGKKAACPFCGNKSSAGIKEFQGQEYFKCFHLECPSGTQGDKGAWDVVDYFAYATGLNRTDAAIQYLKEAGVWKDRESHAPSVMPGKAPRRKKLPEGLMAETPATDLPNPESESAPGNPQGSPLPQDPGPSPTGFAGATQSVPPATLGQSAEKSLLNDGGSAVQQSDSGLSAGPVAPTAVASSGADPVGASNLSDVPSEMTNDQGPMTTGAEMTSGMARFLGEDAPAAGGGEKKADGGGDGTDGTKPPGSDDSRPRDNNAALKWFYDRTRLTDEDLQKLWTKRGLTPATCAAFGFRSSLREYKETLAEMRNHFPIQVLLDSGLWKQGERAKDAAGPNPQYYGWGIKGKAKEGTREHKKGDVVWDWTLPILIPYFDATGELVFLRPHKGNPKGSVPRMFIARPQLAPGGEDIFPPRGNVVAFPGQRSVEFAVITEGEFKVAALWQVLGQTVAISALPGITMVKQLLGDVEDWLDEIGIGQRPVVVAYDNEEKGDPKLPGFTERKEKRFESQVWGRYLVRQICKAGHEGRLGTLPKEWREPATGKADWDGALAWLIEDTLREMEGQWTRRPTDPQALWEVARRIVQEQFLQVLNAASRNEQLAQLVLFSSEEERIIANRLEWISYVPKLPSGGDDEENISRRLRRLVRKLRNDDHRLPAKARGFLLLLAKHYQEVKGGYYKFKKLTDAHNAAWLGHLSNASGSEDVEVKRACEVALEGIPQRISDFIMKAHYVLKRTDGTRVRLVTIHTVNGVDTALEELPSAAFAQPSKWREWLMNKCTQAAWAAGERELNDLQMDVGRALAFKDVSEVTLRGWHEPSKLFFFQDAVYAPDGKRLFPPPPESPPDKFGIIWHEGHGYKMAKVDQEGEELRQGFPHMRPLRVAGAEAAGTETGTQPRFVADLFRDYSDRMYETIGNYQGWLGVGMVLAAAAAPEIYNKYNAFPGLWVHGQQSQGKTSVCGWLMRIWGFELNKGMSLSGTSGPGLSISMQQYSALPFWFDEFQPETPKWMIEQLKRFFGREKVGKKTFGEQVREIRATSLVSGVATSHDGQLRSRYAYVQVSAKNRLKNWYEWFQERSPDFFFIGRYIIERRKEFAEMTLAALKGWMSSSSLVNLDERSRLVHGVAFAAFYAMSAMLECHDPARLDQFRDYLKTHSQESMEQVERHVNVNQFWLDVIAANKSDAFGETPGERRRVWKAVEMKGAPPPVTEFQLREGAEHPKYAWRSYRLYFLPDAVISMLRRFKRMQGLEVPLERNDLLMQMRTQSYWVPPPGKEHKQRFGHGQRGESCWAIDVNKHELGCIRVDDETFDSSRRTEDGNFFARDEWVDPRCGDLFALVDSLASQKEQELAAEAELHT